MQLTIVEPDSLAIVDGKAQHFELSGFDLPENFWALQWQNNTGHIEFNQYEAPGKKPETIDALPGWTQPIIDEHQRLTSEQEDQQDALARKSLFIGNGQARKGRIQQQTIARKHQEHKQINDFLKEHIEK